MIAIWRREGFLASCFDIILNCLSKAIAMPNSHLVLTSSATVGSLLEPYEQLQLHSASVAFHAAKPSMIIGGCLDGSAKGAHLSLVQRIENPLLTLAAGFASKGLGQGWAWSAVPFKGDPNVCYLQAVVSEVQDPSRLMQILQSKLSAPGVDLANCKVLLYLGDGGFHTDYKPFLERYDVPVGGNF
jgi:hypothetical protein